MKTPWITSLAFVGLLAMQSHAIFGIGGHWAPALGFEVKGNKDTIASGVGNTILLDEKGLSGLQGFGAKIWIDALPFIDLQLSGNMQFGYYDVNLITPGDTSALKFDLKMPLLQGKPFFARAYGDAAILYPFLKFPPGISILKVYGGGGLTYGVATEILSSKLAKSALTQAATDGKFDPNTNGADVVGPLLVDAIKNKGFKTGMGGFVQLGAQAKPPIIPIAVYLDFKYHFLGFSPDLASGSGLTMELGGALAF